MDLQTKCYCLTALAILVFPIGLFIGYKIGLYSQSPVKEDEEDSNVVFCNDEDTFPPKIEGDAK